MARIVAIILMLAAGALVWLGYDQLNLLRRTVFWEFRFILLALAAFLILSLAEWIAGRIGRLFSTDQTET